MKENDLSTKLAARMRTDIRNSVVFKHADSFTHGIPDISLTANGRSSWWEVKFADPKFNSTGIQELNCLRLAKISICYYVIYDQSFDRTLIVHPFQFKEWRTHHVASVSGFDHAFVADYARKRHL